MKVEILAGIVVATGMLSLRFLLTGRPVLIIVTIAGALLWLAGTWRGGRSAANTGLFLFTALIIASLLAGPNSIAWSLPPLLASIVAWNGMHLHFFIADSPNVPEKGQLLRRHRTRLYATLAIGVLLLVVTLLVQLNLTFTAVVLLSLLGMLALSRAIYFLSHTGT